MRVALAFLLTDSFPFERVWLRYLEAAKRAGLTLLPIVHNKHPIKSDFVKTYETKEKAKTTWGQTVPAHRHVVGLADAMKADFVVWVCGSTWPAQRPEALFNFLASHPYSYFTHAQKLDVNWANRTFAGYPKLGNRHKAEQWYILNRRHFPAFVDFKFASYYRSLHADNEFYPLAAIQMAGLARGVCKQDTMLTQWIGHVAHPATIVPAGFKISGGNTIDYTPELFNLAGSNGYFFMRKIHPSLGNNVCIDALGL